MLKERLHKMPESTSGILRQKTWEIFYYTIAFNQYNFDYVCYKLFAQCKITLHYYL